MTIIAPNDLRDYSKLPGSMSLLMERRFLPWVFKYYLKADYYSPPVTDYTSLAMAMNGFGVRTDFEYLDEFNTM